MYRRQGSEMQLCTVLALLVSCVYLNQAIYGADAEVSYSKFHDAEGNFPVKATNPDDVAAVKALYKSTNGPNWSSSTSWMKGDPCSSPWQGITCYMINNEARIVEIFLRYNNLVGTIPTDIAKLSELRSLVLSYNTLNGTLLQEIFQIHTLQNIELSSNSLTGSLPTKLSMQNLMKLLLDMNHLTGSITAVWNTPKLQILDLNQNQFTGNLPEGISSLKSLQELDLSQNNLAGPLPASYGKLSNLSILSLHQNRFKNNSIPESWSGLKSLSEIHLDGLSGNIPSTIADWPNIKHIDLGNGQLNANIPTFICDCRNLMSIRLYNNALRGPLPECICSMRSVSVIDISNNQISGSIPSCIKNMPFLFEIHFSRNNLMGTIPELAANQSNFLQTLDISHNSLHGALPTSLNKLGSIQNFIINDNHFTLVSGIESFFMSLSNNIDIFGDGSCAMDNNPWRCPIPNYVLPICNATCEPQ